MTSRAHLLLTLSVSVGLARVPCVAAGFTLVSGIAADASFEHGVPASTDIFNPALSCFLLVGEPGSFIFMNTFVRQRSVSHQ